MFFEAGGTLGRHAVKKAASEGGAEAVYRLAFDPALLGHARAHLGAAGWVPLCRLRDWTNPKTKTNRGSGDSTEASPNGHHGHRGRHRMSGEEVSLVHQAESLIADLTATRSAYVMSELVAGGAADYLARRLSSLVTSEGRLLSEGGGPPPERFVEGSGGWGAKAGAAIERGIGKLGAKATRVVIDCSCRST